LPLSHDEVVHLKKSLLAKMSGDYWQQCANARALYAYMFAHPGKKLLFMGAELGQWTEWNHDSQLAWELLDHPAHRALQQFMKELNHLYASQPALYEVDFDWQGFEWIDFRDVDQSIVSFYRKAKDPADIVVVAANFTPVVRNGYRIGVPFKTTYHELLNTDATKYWGSNTINAEGLMAEDTPWQNQPYSMALTLPPLGVVYLKPEGVEVKPTDAPNLLPA
jgi:1,4-alpha-glucan branching enzyme